MRSDERKQMTEKRNLRCMIASTRSHELVEPTRTLSHTLLLVPPYLIHFTHPPENIFSSSSSSTLRSFTRHYHDYDAYQVISARRTSQDS